MILHTCSSYHILSSGKAPMIIYCLLHSCVLVSYLHRELWDYEIKMWKYSKKKGELKMKNTNINILVLRDLMARSSCLVYLVFQVKIHSTYSTSTDSSLIRRTIRLGSGLLHRTSHRHSWPKFDIEDRQMQPHERRGDITMRLHHVIFEGNEQAWIMSFSFPGVLHGGDNRPSKKKQRWSVDTMIINEECVVKKPRYLSWWMMHWWRIAIIEQWK